MLAQLGCLWRSLPGIVSWDNKLLSEHQFDERLHGTSGDEFMRQDFQRPVCRKKLSHLRVCHGSCSLEEAAFGIFRDVWADFGQFANILRITEKSTSTVPSVNEHTLLKPFSSAPLDKKWPARIGITLARSAGEALRFTFPPST